MQHKRYPIIALAGILALAPILSFGLVGCDSDSDVASENLKTAAENFEILRHIVFYNGITGDYILEIEGYCSVDPSNVGQIAVTCKTAVKGKDGAKEDEFKKSFLGAGDNVTWFAEQMDAVNVSTKHYRAIWKPSVIIPQPEVK